MDVALNADLLAVGIAVAAMVVLGFVIFLQDPKNLTAKLFLFFTLVSAGWSVSNYISYQASSDQSGLLLIRLVIFFAVLQALSFFLLMYVFPADKVTYPRWLKYFIFPSTIFTAFLTLTPAVFREAHLVVGQAPQPTVAPGIGLFALVSVGLVLSGIFLLVRKMRGAKDGQRKQFRSLLYGVLLMFSLIVVLDFILPAFLSNTRFIPLGGVFILPFVFFTAYAIIKHGLFNVKVIATSVLAFSLDVALFFEVILSKDPLLIFLRSSVFVLVLAIGILLIRSVIREVKQREQLQRLTQELEKANDELRKLDQARAEFITIASHQLRTPPSTIKWYIAAIMDGDFGKLSEELRAALQRVRIANDAQISTIDDLLNVSRLERGKMEYLFELADLQETTEQLVQQLEPLAIMKKLTLIYHKPTTELPKIMMDKEKIRQVINNFIDNAIKYSKQGAIIVDLVQREDALEVRVSDQGKGLTPDEASHLFQKFTRGKDSVSHASGLGLGLYVTKIVIEQHKGKIWAESKGPGNGSTFAFSLPIHSTLKPTRLEDLTPSPKGF